MRSTYSGKPVRNVEDESNDVNKTRNCILKTTFKLSIHLLKTSKVLCCQFYVGIMTCNKYRILILA